MTEPKKVPGQPVGPAAGQAPGRAPAVGGANRAGAAGTAGAAGDKAAPVRFPGAVQAAQAQGKVRQPVAPARFRMRHKFLVLAFLVGVLLPLVVAAWYLWSRAADQYASYLGFSVRTEESSSAIELLGGITELSGSSSSDTDILFSYLTSHELVRKIDAEVGLRGIWSKVSMTRDPVFAYDAPGTIEDLVDHWDRKVSIVYDSGTGMLDLRILAFAPDDAKRIADALLAECTAMINQLSSIAREDAIKYAREELEQSVERLKVARRNLTEFRNRTQIVDPAIDTQNQMGLLVTLQQQLAEALIELDLLHGGTRADDPRIVQAQRRVDVIEERIAAERRKLGLGASGSGEDVFATLVGEYEGLVVEREFAERAYTSALAAYDGAQADARKQSRYLAAHVRPTLAEKAEYPERAKIFGLLAVFLMLGWAIASLVFYSLKDRS